MNRKATLWVWTLVIGASLVFLGCPTKQPTTPAAAMDDTERTVAPEPAEVEEPADLSFGDERPEPWSGPLKDLNERAYREGLLGDVYFDFDKYDLKPEARDRLAKNAQFMKEHPGFTFSIEGHCDERGTNEYNLALGDRRANGARSYLSSLGISDSRMGTISFGEERPVCDSSAESCWRRNRRAHFVITKAD